MSIYNQDSIQTMEFGEATISKIGMYLSGDLQKAVELGFRELIYNSIDEYIQGYGTEINISIDTKNQIFTCEDNARGIPVGTRTDGTNSLVAALTMAHTGGKHNNDVYSGAVGINGMGSSIVTHTAEFLVAEVSRDGNIYQVKFKGSMKGAILEHDVTIIGKTQKTGTKITYKPNPIVYKNEKLQTEELLRTLQELSYFTKGLKIIVSIDGKKETFISKNGLADALALKKAAHKNILHYMNVVEGVEVELALQWVKEDPKLLSYANNLHVPDGGQFVTGFKTSLTKAFNSTLKKEYSGEIIRKYLDGYVSVKVKTPQFSNQAKTSLANPEARTAVAKATTEAVKAFFEKYPKDAEAIIELLEREQRAEVAAQRAREAEKAITTGSKKAKMITNLPSKLADATGTGYRELFLVEGDSAAGNIKITRNHETQGILSLRGKVLNTFNKELHDILKNQEVKDILTTLGCGAGSSVNLKNLRYDKVIIATDSDADGEHIAILLNTLFLQHVTALLLEGKVYRAITPLYGIPKGKGMVYLYSDKELKEYADKYGLPQHYNRYKGLGALNLDETSMALTNENSRILEQMTIEDLDKAIAEYNIMVGKDLEQRKELVMIGGKEQWI